MFGTIFDRLVAFLIMEVGHLLFVLTAVDSSWGQAISPKVVASVVLVNGVLLAICAWLPWFAARSTRVMRIFGAALLVGSVGLGLLAGARPPGWITLACLGLVLMVDAQGSSRRRGRSLPPTG